MYTLIAAGASLSREVQTRTLGSKAKEIREFKLGWHGNRQSQRHNKNKVTNNNNNIIINIIIMRFLLRLLQ